MGKPKPRPNNPSAQEPSTQTAAPTSAVRAASTTSTIAADPVLGSKIRVLLHDFLAVTKDPNAAKRLNSTTDEHYISAPYFDDDQAAVLKTALVDVDLEKRSPVAAPTEYAQADADTEEGAFMPDAAALRGKAFGDALEALLKSFLDKSRASGDARPCGPHHLAPLYAWLFGIELEEVRNDKFLGRLRRNGI